MNNIDRVLDAIALAEEILCANPSIASAVSNAIEHLHDVKVQIVADNAVETLTQDDDNKDFIECPF